MIVQTFPLSELQHILPEAGVNSNIVVVILENISSFIYAVISVLYLLDLDTASQNRPMAWDEGLSHCCMSRLWRTAPDTSY